MRGHSLVDESFTEGWLERHLMHIVGTLLMGGAAYVAFNLAGWAHQILTFPPVR